MAIIIDKINMVSLNLFATVDLHLCKPKVLYKNLAVVLGELLIIIFLSDFFLFFPIIGKSSWKVPLSLYEGYR